jgi:hypothetical protein
MPAIKPFGNQVDVGGPALRLVTITPANSDLLEVLRWIYVGGLGNVSVIDTAGNTVVFTAVPAGTTLGPFYVEQVKLTGTTATNLVGFV